jgi:spermidine synthase
MVILIKRTVLVIFPSLLFFLALGTTSESSEKILFEKNSLYQYISVIEDTVKKERYIVNTKRDYNQGGIYVDTPDRLLYEYTQMSFISLAFIQRQPKDALFVGLGAGAMPRYFNRYYPDTAVDVVEIDPDIFEVAKKYFHFKETPVLKVHLSDGRIFIKRSRKEFDMIFLDAYQNDYIPFHLTTKEFLQEVKGRLRKGGVVVSNITSPFKNKFFDSMIETYNQVFPHLYIFKGRKSNNYIFIATDSSKKIEQDELEKRAEKIQKSKNFDFNFTRIPWAYAYHTEFGWPEAKVLTDDFAPVNLYKHMKRSSKR